MNNKALTLSVVMAVLAVIFVQSYVTGIEEEAKKKYGTEITVIKAKRDIKEMETITETMLEISRVPKRYLEPAAISFETVEGEDSKEATKGLKGLSGWIAIVPVKKGEQITYNKLTEPGMRTGLSPQIAPGRRAIAIPVNDLTGVGKLVKPGDRVDLIAVVDLGGGKENKVSKTILQDVVILAVGRSVTNNVARMVEADPFGGKDKVKSLVEDFSFNTVTLEVEPIQAQTIALLAASGDNLMTLALRNNDDTDRPLLGTTGFGDVLGADASRRMPANVKR